MNTRWRFVAAAALAGAATIGLMLVTTGCTSRGQQNPNPLSPQGTQIERGVPSASSQAAPGIAADAKSAAGQSAGPAVEAQQIVIEQASMNVQVAQLDQAVEKVRAVTAAAGGTISQLSYSQGNSPTPVTPEVAGASSAGQPSTAQMTLRVPASKLAAVEKSVRALGDVQSQSAQETDVTQQHIDLVARIANLQAEEVRLRAMLDKAKNVGEMLAVERELARVQGDIESMQAQLAYLDRQAAQATLNVTLSEPGALVRPGSGGWGLGAAITTGVQAAAIILRTIIATLIALSPVILLGLLIWVVVWSIRRRRRARVAPAEQPQEPSE